MRRNVTNVSTKKARTHIAMMLPFPEPPLIGHLTKIGLRNPTASTSWWARFHAQPEGFTLRSSRDGTVVLSEAVSDVDALSTLFAATDGSQIHVLVFNHEPQEILAVLVDIEHGRDQLEAALEAADMGRCQWAADASPADPSAA